MNLNKHKQRPLTPADEDRILSELAMPRNGRDLVGAFRAQFDGKVRWVRTWDKDMAPDEESVEAGFYGDRLLGWMHIYRMSNGELSFRFESNPARREE